MRRVVGVKLLRANGRKAPPCVFLFPARFFSCQPRCFVRQHPRSTVLVLAFPLPARFFCSQPRCFVRQHPRSAALVLAFLRPPRFFSCQPRCFVRQRPQSAALVLAFLRPPPFFCCATVFLLLCNRVVGSPLLPFRVYFSSLAAAKGFVLLNIRVRRLAPLVVIVRGAQLFLAFLSVVFLLAALFSARGSRVFAVGC